MQKKILMLCFFLSIYYISCSLSWIDWLIDLGLGNYDVNVVTAALLDKQCDIIWFDRRKDPNTIRLGKPDILDWN